VALVIALSAAARLSPPTAWMLLPAGGLALALAVANLLRDALVGIGQALTNRVHRGDHVEIGEVAGEVVRVGIRSLRLKTLDGTIIDIPQRRIAADGIHRLSLEGGGHPVTVMLTIPTDLMGTDLLEEARLAALLARHAHLGRKPTASLVDGHPPAIRVVGHAIDPFCADTYSGEVVGCFQEALHAMIKTAT
jgi:small-conductance mechanosensitive channel